ncbi:MAG: putative transposase YbfD/YdcC [Chlamydiales bacterium]|jgi:predicted transposase YbfD/YdcC
MGTQKDIAEKVVEKGGDYILALKGNHSTLHDEVINYFERNYSGP